MQEGVLQDKIFEYQEAHEKLLLAKSKKERADQEEYNAEREHDNVVTEIKRLLLTEAKRRNPIHILIKGKNGEMAQISFTKDTVVSASKMTIRLYPKISNILAEACKSEVYREI